MLHFWQETGQVSCGKLVLIQGLVGRVAGFVRRGLMALSFRHNYLSTASSIVFRREHEPAVHLRNILLSIFWFQYFTAHLGLLQKHNYFIIMSSYTFIEFILAGAILLFWFQV